MITILTYKIMGSYIYNYYSSIYDNDNRLLSQSKIDEIATELSDEITKEIDKQFEKVFK